MEKYAENIANEIHGAWERGELEEWVDDQLGVDFDTMELIVTYGGPTAWVDIRTGNVFAHYGSNEAKCAIPDDEREALEDYVRFLSLAR